MRMAEAKKSCHFQGDKMRDKDVVRLQHKAMYREYKKLVKDNAKLCKALNNDFKELAEEINKSTKLAEHQTIYKNFGKKMLNKYYYGR